MKRIEWLAALLVILIVNIILLFLITADTKDTENLVRKMFVFDNHMELSKNLEEYQYLDNVRYNKENTYYSGLVDACDIDIVYSSNNIVQFHIINKNMLYDRLFQLEVEKKSGKIIQAVLREVMTVYN